MNNRLLRTAGMALALVLAAGWHSAHAGKPVLKGEISGIELAPQSIAGEAIFVFDYHGWVNGRLRWGWGWMGVKHEPLDELSEILGGEGEIYVGFQRFSVTVDGGFLKLIDENNPLIFDDDFGVMLFAHIRDLWGRSNAHVFKGVLSHAVFPPEIDGDLCPEED